MTEKKDYEQQFIAELSKTISKDSNISELMEIEDFSDMFEKVIQMCGAHATQVIWFQREDILLKEKEMKKLENKDTVDKLYKTIKDLTETNKNLQTQTKFLESKDEVWTEKIEVKKQKLEKLEKEKSNFECELEEKEEEIKDLEEKNFRFKKTIENLVNKSCELNKELVEYHQKVRLYNKIEQIVSESRIPTRMEEDEKDEQENKKKEEREKEVIPATPKDVEESDSEILPYQPPKKPKTRPSRAPPKKKTPPKKKKAKDSSSSEEDPVVIEDSDLSEEEPKEKKNKKVTFSKPISKQLNNSLTDTEDDEEDEEESLPYSSAFNPKLPFDKKFLCLETLASFWGYSYMDAAEYGKLIKEKRKLNIEIIDFSPSAAEEQFSVNATGIFKKRSLSVIDAFILMDHKYVIKRLEEFVEKYKNNRAMAKWKQFYSTIYNYLKKNNKI